MNDASTLWTAVSRRVRAVGGSLPRTRGDRPGVALALGSLFFIGLFWRIGFFVTDSYAIGNALVNVAAGSLSIETVRYSVTLGSQPGLYTSGGELYARNYGHVVAALPVLLALEGLALLADPRLVLAAAWSLLPLGIAAQVGAAVGRREEAVLVGSGASLSLFLWNAALAAPLDPRWLPLVALQLTAAVAATTVAVALYRLVASIHGRRLGLAAGVAVVAATPVGFWATIPKRHVLTAALATVALYGFYRGRRSLAPRAAAYAAVGLSAWIHPFEALVLALAFVPLDLLTGARGRRELAVLAAVFLVAVTPFLATNAAVSGNPLESPRMLPSYSADGDVLSDAPGPDAGADETGSTAPEQEESDGAGGGESGPGPPPVSVGTLLDAGGTAAGIPARAAGYVGRGLGALSDPGRLYHVFVRSGHIPGVDYAVNGHEAVELTVVESMPLLGALLAAPALLVRRARGSVRWADPAVQTDAFAAGYAGLLVLVYLPLLPLFSQITVRYLLPAFPALLYLVCRIPAVRRAVDAEWRLLGAAYAGFAAAGAVALLAILGTARLGLGEAVQLHALANLAGAAVLGGWATAHTLDPTAPLSGERAGAVALALPAALATLFLAFAGLAYFRYGQYALGIARELSALAGL